MGDPLSLDNLVEYLDIAHHYSYQVMITTAGHLINNHPFSLFTHPALHQLNISLTAYYGGSIPLTIDEYLSAVHNLTTYLLKNKKELFINWRFWTHHEELHNHRLSHQIQTLLMSYSFDWENFIKSQKNRFLVQDRFLLNKDEPFEWPSMNNPCYGEQGYCYGLKTHIAILHDGRVIPCCLDSDGILSLGNIFSMSLEDILHSPRTLRIKQGFQQKKVIEPLCQHCHYRLRFKG